MKDTSHHPKLNTAPTFGMSSMRQGDDTMRNPGHNNSATRPIFKAQQYTPDLMDHDGEDIVREKHPDIEAMEKRWDE